MTEVAARLRVDPATVKRYIQAGKLEGFKLPGGFWRVYADSVDALVNGHE